MDKMKVFPSRLRRPRAPCSLSFVDYRPDTNVAILRNTGHTKGRSHRRGVGKPRA
jgi:hypothetical protein